MLSQIALNGELYYNCAALRRFARKAWNWPLAFNVAANVKKRQVNSEQLSSTRDQMSVYSYWQHLPERNQFG